MPVNSNCFERKQIEAEVSGGTCMPYLLIKIHFGRKEIKIYGIEDCLEPCR